MKDIALVRDSIVQNIALAGDPPDEGWMWHMEQQFDAVVDVTGIDPRPAVGWIYDGTNFAEPPNPEPVPEPTPTPDPEP